MGTEFITHERWHQLVAGMHNTPIKVFFIIQPRHFVILLETGARGASQLLVEIFRSDECLTKPVHNFYLKTAFKVCALQPSIYRTDLCEKMQVVIVFFPDFKCDCDQNISDISRIYIYFIFIFLKILYLNVLKIF
jgi:hypothetical protein